MILQREITDKAQEWEVPPATVEKDYVLGHFLSVFLEQYNSELVFKGGTCLRKCYFEKYRFSEDLDFSALDKTFELKQKTIEQIAKTVEKRTGIQFFVEKIKPISFQDQPKGFQVYIKYWGANHSKNQRPLLHARWHTKIKLEISTDEIILFPVNKQKIIHHFSDELSGEIQSACYSLEEVITEKLRALKQRSYTAPRDFYDLYFLTQGFTKDEWQNLIPVFLKKMEHKNLEYISPRDLIDDAKLLNVKRAWKTSVAHQVKPEIELKADEIIEIVVERINLFLPK